MHGRRRIADATGPRASCDEAGALDYNVSIAAWVGVIARLGLDAETGVFMLLFLDLAYDEAKKGNRLNTCAELCHLTLGGSGRGSPGQDRTPRGTTPS